MTEKGNELMKWLSALELFCSLLPLNEDVISDLQNT